MRHAKKIKNRKNPAGADNSSKLAWFVLGTATVVGAYLVFSKEDTSKQFPPEGVSKAKSKSMGMKQGGVIVESVNMGKESLDLYQYPTSSKVDINVDIPFTQLLTENDLSKLTYTETLPKMGVAKDVVDRSSNAVALRGLSEGDRTSSANKQILKGLLGVDPSSLSQGDRQVLANLLESVELAVTSFDKKCPMDLGAFDSVRRQRIWANVLWTVINRASQAKGSKSLSSSVLQILGDNQLPLYTGVPGDSIAFVNAFLRGYFNAEISLANNFFIFSKGSLAIPKKAISSSALGLDGEPVIGLRKLMEPAWLEGVVFYSDEMGI